MYLRKLQSLLGLFLFVCLFTACSDESKKSGSAKPLDGDVTVDVANDEPSVPQEIEIPEIVYDYPVQDSVESYESDIKVRFWYDESAQALGKEAVSIVFNRYGRLPGSRHLYTFEKSYMGPKDNSKFLIFGSEDDVIWNSPWRVISINLRSFTVFGGDEVGEGTPIGFIHHLSNGEFEIEFFGEFEFDQDELSLSLKSPEVQPTLRIDCPGVVEAASLCEVYSSLYNALSSVDYSAIGEAGPKVASNILSVGTVFDIVKSVWFFEPSVDEIRDEYLIPVLLLIKDLKRLGTLDQSDRENYILETSEVYTDVIKTSVKTVLKTQRLMPEALNDYAGASFGVILAYVGAEGAGDDYIARKQPAWFKELVSPIIREIGILAIDLVVNSSNTDLETRLKRFIELESELKAAVSRLCSSSNTNQCLEALR